MTHDRDNPSKDEACTAGRHFRDDRGVSIILVALLLVPLLVFVAFAVDLGGLYAERRQDQTAADVAALAAAQDLPKGEATMVATAKTYAHDTLGTTIPDGTDGWNSCPRPDPAGLSIQAAGASCISYNGSQVRVRLPDRFYPSAFGGVVGIPEYRHTAFAIAGSEPAGFGGVLPFFLSDASAASGYGCLIAAGPGPCDPASGKFAQLQFAWYTPVCADAQNTSDETWWLENNTAAGVDHLLSRFNQAPHFGVEVVDEEPCPLNPNAAEPFTGNKHDENREGLLLGDGFRGGDARLQRQIGSGPSLPRITAFGENLDNTPLWWFIPENYGPPTADIPTSCKRDQFVNSSGQYYADLRANPVLDLDVAAHLMQFPSESQRVLGLMVRCFDHYDGRSWDGYPGALATPDLATGCSGPCDDPVFAKNSSTSDVPDLYDIQYTPRFGYAPEALNATLPSGGSDPIRFDRFRAIYLNRITLGNDSVVWDPYTTPVPPASSGGVPGNKNTPVEAFFFPDKMLPNGLGAPDAPNAINVNRFIQLIR